MCMWIIDEIDSRQLLSVLRQHVSENLVEMLRSDHLKLHPLPLQVFNELFDVSCEDGVVGLIMLGVMRGGPAISFDPLMRLVRQYSYTSSSTPRTRHT